MKLPEKMITSLLFVLAITAGILFYVFIGENDTPPFYEHQNENGNKLEGIAIRCDGEYAKTHSLALAYDNYEVSKKIQEYCDDNRNYNQQRSETK